jgi:hypothetical protein
VKNSAKIGDLERFFVRRWSETPPRGVKSARKSDSFGNFSEEIGGFLFNFSRNGGVLDRNRAFSKKTKWIIGSKTRVVKKSTEICQEGDVGFRAKNGGPEIEKCAVLQKTGVCRVDNTRY